MHTHSERRVAEACGRVVRHIDAHHTEPLTARQLGEVAHLSEFYLQRAFARTLGMTIGQHLRRRRVEHAMALLVSRALPLEAVARATGLGSAAALVHLFKRETGLTPGAFRRAGHAASLQALAPGFHRHACVDAGDLAACRVVQRAATPVLVLCAGGMRARNFSGVGFALVDALWAEYRRLWPAAPRPVLVSVYPDGALSPDDPTNRVLLCAPLPAGGPAPGQPGPGFCLDQLPGGSYLQVPVRGPHTDAWLHWSRIARGPLPQALGWQPRPEAFTLEMCRAVVGFGAARERDGVSLLLPVADPRQGPHARAAQAEEDRACLATLRPRAGDLFERLLHQPA